MKRTKFGMTGKSGALGLAMLGVAGCALLPQKGWGSPPAGAPPLVQDCAIVTISSPTRYACNGKVYTSFDLERQRLAWETAQSTQTNPPRVPAKY
jgi:aspartate aminotransferase-like enzyme